MNCRVGVGYVGSSLMIVGPDHVNPPSNDSAASVFTPTAVGSAVRDDDARCVRGDCGRQHAVAAPIDARKRTTQGYERAHLLRKSIKSIPLFVVKTGEELVHHDEIFFDERNPHKSAVKSNTWPIELTPIGICVDQLAPPSLLHEMGGCIGPVKGRCVQSVTPPIAPKSRQTTYSSSCPGDDRYKSSAAINSWSGLQRFAPVGSGSAQNRGEVPFQLIVRPWSSERPI